MPLMKKPAIEEFFRRLQKALPEPETELQYHNPYTLLVAVVPTPERIPSRLDSQTRLDLVGHPRHHPPGPR